MNGSALVVSPANLAAQTEPTEEKMPPGNLTLYKSLPLILLFLVQGIFTSFAQNEYGSEKELKTQAEKLFKEEEYPAAMPLFSQLLSLYPADPNYNYKFGVCLLYATEDKEKPLGFLRTAIGKEGVDDDIFYHLGRAYHLNYRFAEALAQYAEFKKRSSGKTSTRLEVDRQIEMCRNGQDLLKNITDLVVLERKTMNEAEYFRAYDLTLISAKLVVKPEDLMTAADKKKKDKSTIVVRQTSSDIYFSSYGEDGKNRDIYKTSRLPNFTWTKPVNLGAIINTPYDEDFPYVSADGKTLYFSSKGHNSMGGYDVFKSEWDAATNTWGKPVNMDFAVNTPDDDIQYIPDALGQNAYFSSRRSVPSGKITIYKISTTRIPPTIAMVRGQYFRASSSDPLPKIIIRGVETKKQVGTYKPKSADGLFRVNLGVGNRYEYAIELPGMPPVVQMVDIPAMTEERPLRQEIRPKKKDGVESFEILTFFADTSNDEGSQLARAEWLKAKAGLDVNSDVVQEGSSANAVAVVENEKKKQEVQFVEAGSPGLTNNRLVEIANEDAQEAKKEADDAKIRAGKAYAYANQKSFLAREKYAQAGALAARAESATSTQEKQSLGSEADANRASADLMAIEAKAAYNLALALDRDAAMKKQEAAQAIEYAARVDRAIRSNDRQEINKLAEESSKEPEAVAQSETDSANAQKEIASRQMLIAKLKENNFQIDNELAEGNQELARLKEEQASAKNEKKQQLSAQIQEMESGQRAREKEKLTNTEKILKYQTEVDLVVAEEKISREINVEGNKSGFADLSEAERQKLSSDIQALERNLEARVVASAATTSSVKSLPETNPSPVSPTEKNIGVANAETSLNTKKNPAETVPQSPVFKPENERRVISPALMMAAAEKLDDRADSVAALMRNETDEQRIIALDAEAKALREESNKKLVEVRALEFRADNVKNIAMNDVLLEKEKALQAEGKAAQAAELSKELAGVQKDLDKSRELKGSVVPSMKARQQDSIYALSSVLQKQALKEQEQLIKRFGASMQDVSARNQAPFNSELALSKATAATTASEAVAQAYSPKQYETSIALKSQSVDSVRSSETFIQFDYLLSKSDTLKDKAMAQARRSDALVTQGQKKLADSQTLIEQASAERSKSKKDLLLEEAIRMDNEGKGELAEADSLRKLAVNNAIKAAVIEEQASKYLASLPSKQADVIIAALEDPTPGPASLSGQSPTVAVSLPEVSANNPDVNQKKEADNPIAQKLSVVAAEEKKNEPARLEEKGSGNVEETAVIPVPVTENEKLVTDSNKSESQALAQEKKSAVESPLADANRAKSSSEQEQNKEGAENATVSPDGNVVEKREITKPDGPITEEKRQSTDKPDGVQQVALVDTTLKSGMVSMKSEESAVATSTQEQITPEKKAEIYWAETRKDPAYQEYSAFKEQSSKAKKQGDLFKAQSDSLRKESDEIFQRSTDLLEFAAAQDSKKKQKEAAAQAIEFDREAREKRKMSDSVASLSGIKYYESLQAQKKADAYAETLPSEKRRAFLMSYENIVPDIPAVVASKPENKAKTATSEEPKEQKEQEVAVANNQNKSLSDKEAKSASVKEAANKSVSQDVQKTNPDLAVERKETGSEIKTEISPVNTGTASSSAEKRSEQSSENNPVQQDNRASVPVVKEEKVGPSAEQIKATAAYKQYEAVMNEISSLKSVSEPSRREADLAKAEADTLYKQYNSKLELAANEKKKERKRLVEEAKVLQAKEIDSRKIADSLQNIALNKESITKKKEEEAAAILSSLDSRSATQIKEVYTGVYVQETIRTEVVSAAEPSAKETKTDLSLAASAENRAGKGGQKKQVAATTSAPATKFASSGGNYGVSNKIPMNPSLPPGVIYKVQIGAFNRPVPDNAFGGITPVSGETKGNLIRYTAGMFGAFAEASSARQTLNGLGYNDAFVVAYCNGVRIPVVKAREYEREGRDCAGEAIATKQTGGNEGTVVESGQGKPGQSASEVSSVGGEAAVKEIAPGATLPQKGFEVVKGLVYTVQVGVYSKPVTAGQLFNLQPLYYDRTAKGLYRYSTGVYNNIPDAVKAKNIVVQIGISDAFVTAYFEGKRVSMPEAAGMVAKNGQAVFIEREDMNRMPSQLRVSGSATVRNAEPERTESSATANQTATGTGVQNKVVSPEVNVANLPVNIEYRVQIGAFRKEVPVEMMNKFLSIASMGISSGKTAEGLTIYSVGKFKDFSAAEKVKTEVQAQGITDAFVAPYNNGTRISIEEAKRLEK